MRLLCVVGRSIFGKREKKLLNQMKWWIGDALLDYGITELSVCCSHKSKDPFRNNRHLIIIQFSNIFFLWEALGYFDNGHLTQRIFISLKPHAFVSSCWLHRFKSKHFTTKNKNRQLASLWWRVRCIIFVRNAVNEYKCTKSDLKSHKSL